MHACVKLFKEGYKQCSYSKLASSEKQANYMCHVCVCVCVNVKGVRGEGGGGGGDVINC